MTSKKKKKSEVTTTRSCHVTQTFAQTFDRQLMCDYWVSETGESLLNVCNPKPCLDLLQH